MTQDNRIWVLMARRLSGEATAKELAELEQLLELDPSRQYQFDLLHSYFSKDRTSPSAMDLQDADLENRFSRIIARPGTSVKMLFLRRTMVAAAAIAGLVIGSAILLHRTGSSAVVRTRPVAHGEEVLARAGARTKLVLPDGTKVWLNSSSKLIYNSDFNVSHREVSLEGEAYFDVARNANHPFVVHASPLIVTALGTSFTVKSYPQDRTIEATLLSGSIEVTRKDNAHPMTVILRPNEKLVYDRQAPERSSSAGPDASVAGHTTDIAVNSLSHNIPDSNKVETSWLYNRLVFDGDSFPVLAEKMERWFNVRIILKDESLAGYRFGGVFANESIEQALAALQLTAAFTYKINGNEIELYAK